jgi:UDP-N-acetylmuramate--alanine ligase
MLLVSVEHQHLFLIRGRKIAAQYPVSTSKYGVGGLKGSLKTPPGLHRIFRKIGHGRPRGSVFKDRVPTGERWDGRSLFGDLILTRIFVLDGLEKGVNRGGRVDSRARYIYIHGTNHEAAVGRPASHGCVTMRNRDILELFRKTRKGDLVIIV